MSGLFTFVFVASILFSIGLHEFGHFATAKRFGVKVHQFFIGFGPKLWSVRKGETEYGVKALPLGGFVRIAGMNPFEEIPPEDRERVFRAKKPWQRAIVLAAGSFTHFVLALGILAAVLALSGSIDFDRPTTVIGGVSERFEEESSPAAEAEPVNAPGVGRGLRAGDRVVAIDGNRTPAWEEVRRLLSARPGVETIVAVERAGRRIDFRATLADHRPGQTVTEGFLGIGPRFATKRYGAIGAVGEAGKRTGVLAKESLFAFKEIFSPSTLQRLGQVARGERERTIEDPTTLIGVGAQAGGLGRSGDWASLFTLIAGLNVFIGVANLLPLPPLDGGHLAVLGYEKVRRRDVDMRRLLPVTATVITVFGTLFIFLLYLDIVRPLPPIPG